MKETFTPIADKVLIQPIEAPKYEGKLVLLESSMQNSNRGKVIGIGPKVAQVKIGDVVIYRQITSIGIELGQGTTYLAQENDIIAVVTNGGK
jgi:co-chaperonin GroES (HSP10)